MSMITEPTVPTKRAAAQSMEMIKTKLSVVGLCVRFRVALEVAGFWAMESKMMFRMTKRIKPIIDARRRNMNFLVVRQGWANARMKTVAERKASSTPGGLSSMPMDVALNAKRTQITKNMSVVIIFRGVESASIITTFFSS